jgi:hypothetical protein
VINRESSRVAKPAFLGGPAHGGGSRESRGLRPRSGGRRGRVGSEAGARVRAQENAYDGSATWTVPGEAKGRARYCVVTKATRRRRTRDVLRLQDQFRALSPTRYPVGLDAIYSVISRVSHCMQCGLLAFAVTVRYFG